jgi:hypothetical protein
LRPLRTRILAPATLILIAVSLASRAGATEPVSTADATVHHVAVSVVVGFGTPLGWRGLEAQVDVLPWLVLSGGAGQGLSSGSPQVAGMARLRWPIRTPTGEVAFTGGYGISRGEFVWTPFCLGFDAGDSSNCGARKSGMLWWHNAELAFEFRSGYLPLPFIARVFAGVGKPGNPGALTCEGNCPRDPEEGTGALPFVGVSFGLFLH